MLGQKLKEIRKAKGLTQEEVARRLSTVQRPAYAKYESGENEPSISTILELAKIFDISLDELLGNTKFDDFFDDWITEIINADDKKKELMRTIWNGLKNL